MNSKLKVMTVVGTRPEIIRLSRVLHQLDRHTEHILVHTGQNYDYELNEIFFKELELRAPDFYLAAAADTPGQTIASVIAKVDETLASEKPDALLVLGDTNSCLAVLPAKRRKIPIFHMEAGNRCFDFRVPEEINRRIVDHVADINLPYSDIAREYLLREGLPPDRIIKTGSPMYEVLAHHRAKIDKSEIVRKLGLEPHEYYVVSCHREENVDVSERLHKLVLVLNGIAKETKRRIIVSTHPRTRKRLEMSSAVLNPLVELKPPLGFIDYIALELSARVVLSDSGTISEESSILGLPALNIRDAHERPEAMEEGAVMMSGLEPERVFQCLDILEAERTAGGGKMRLVADYSVPNVSEKILRIILSYTDYVRRNIWRNS